MIKVVTRIDLKYAISLESLYSFEAIVELLRIEGWKAYFEDLAKLRSAFEKSLIVYEIRKNNEIIGFIRLLGDGIHTLLIQDLLIRKEERGKGIGSKVINDIIEIYKDVRQVIVLCDSEKELVEFYKRNRFKTISENGIQCFGIF